MKNVRLYIRVSHEEQVKFGYSIDAQINALKTYCKENKLIVKGRYVDEGISAYSIKKRHALQKMINESENGDIILFTKLDRFSRNVLDANIILKNLNDKGVSIKAINEDDIDTSTADGKFIFDLKLSLAERERNKTSERINDVFKYKAQKGESISGKVPRGYKVVNKKYVPSDLAPVIKEIFSYYDTYSNISKTMRYIKETHNLNWSFEVVKQILKNKIYIGVHKYNGEFCTPLIDKGLFDRVQNKLERNNKKPRTYIYLFSKLIKCPCCGSVLVGNSNVSTKEPSYYYRCNTYYRNHGALKCSSNKTFSEKKLENYLVNNIHELLEVYIADIDKKNKPMPNNNNKISALKRKIARLKDLYVEELIDIDTYKKDYNKYKEELKRLTPTIENKASDAIMQLMNVNIPELYKKLTREDKQAFWQSIIKEIHIIDQNNENYEIFFN